MMENSREIILDTLLEMERNKVFSHQVIGGVLEKYDYLDVQEKRFIRRILEGCIERKIELDYLIEQYATLTVSKMKPLIRCVLRMGVYQILYMDSVPDSAACNEAVKLTVKRKFGNLKGFVNGVLRRIESEKENLPYPDIKKQPILGLSVRFSMPEWIIRMWIEEYGIATTENMLKNLLEEHPVTIRFSFELSEDEIKKYVAQYEAMGIKVKQSKVLGYAYTLKGVEGIATLPGFMEGAFVVQDLSSMLCMESAQIKETDQILDCCAAPGGKTIFAAQRGKTVISRDVSEKKILRIQENVERMKLQEKVKVEVYDATKTDASLVGKMDVVLLDVPCSGLGVMGKKKDIKYNAAPESMESLCELQKRIVEHCVPYVKEGGTLMYSTCTIHKKENEEMCQYIAEKFPFTLVEMKQILPESKNIDGFFYGKFIRNKDEEK